MSATANDSAGWAPDELAPGGDLASFEPEWGPDPTAEVVRDVEGWTDGVVSPFAEAGLAPPPVIGGAAEPGEFEGDGILTGFTGLVRRGMASAAVLTAVAGGERDENTLTNQVFFARHPELGGRAIRPDERALRTEWLQIRDRLVRPLLAGRGAGPPVPPTTRQRLRTQRLREAWAAYAGRADLMVGVDMLGRRVQVNPRIAEAVGALGRALAATGHRADRVGGFSDRVIRGTARRSLHAYGLAVDIDARHNPHRRGRAGPARWSTAPTQAGRRADVAANRADTSFTPEQIAAASTVRTVDGFPVFFWAGHWRTSPDAMHFQVDVTPDELARGLARPEPAAQQEYQSWEDDESEAESEEDEGEPDAGLDPAAETFAEPAPATWFEHESGSPAEPSDEDSGEDSEEESEEESEEDIEPANRPVDRDGGTELESPLEAIRRLWRNAVEREIVLVAGTNYPAFSQDGRVWRRKRRLSAGPWRDYCLRLAAVRLKASPTLKVTLFDFLRGTRESVTLDTRQQVVTTVLEHFTAPTATDYRNVVGVDLSAPNPAHVLAATLEPGDRGTLATKPQVHFFDGATDRWKGPTPKLWADFLDAPPTVAAPAMSVTDVYAYIQGLTTSGRAGTLRELHFFAHAFNATDARYSGGPILLNTLDNPMRTDRHPLDKDCRAAKDFTAPTMDPAVFARAFSADARSFVWGCNFQRGFIRQFVAKLGQSRAAIAAGRPMTVSYTPDWGTMATFRSRLGLADTAPVKRVAVDLPKIEEVLAEANRPTYMQRLATASGHPVVGAPPGTYTDLDAASSPLPLLHVPMTRDPFRTAGDSFEQALVVFRDVLKVRFDTSFGDHIGLGRGYILYEP